jgi:hypothetical protein
MVIAEVKVIGIYKAETIEVASSCTYDSSTTKNWHFMDTAQNDLTRSGAGTWIDCGPPRDTDCTCKLGQHAIF